MTMIINFLVLCFTYIYSAQSSKNNDWDLLVFTQQWPITVCKKWKEKNIANSCVLPKDVDSWTIHGIWPTRLGTKGPVFCNRSWHFDVRQVEPFETMLMQMWPNIKAGHDMYSFWTHEWNKHGTCAATLEAFDSEAKYFSKGMEWLKKYAMNDILRSTNIVPSNTNEYTIESIYNAIKSKLGVDPVIKCRQEKGQNYLFEIHFCFQKNLELIDCDGVTNKYIINRNNIITNCNTSQGVIYIENLAH